MQRRRRGLLIRGGDALEAASRVDTVVLDKTGTLTVGKPRVTAVRLPVGGLSHERLLALAAAVERSSTHPLAQAVVAAAGAAGGLLGPCQGKSCWLMYTQRRVRPGAETGVLYLLLWCLCDSGICQKLS